MTEFKQGDRVRVSSSFYNGPCAGEILTVKDARATYLYLTTYQRSGWDVSHFELVDRPVKDYWDESKHTGYNTWHVSNWSTPSDYGVVLLLINVVQHLQPRWVERPVQFKRGDKVRCIPKGLPSTHVLHPGAVYTVSCTSDLGPLLILQEMAGHWFASSLFELVEAEEETVTVVLPREVAERYAALWSGPVLAAACRAALEQDGEA